jgi:ribose transport system substrate-binding protein
MKSVLPVITAVLALVACGESSKPASFSVAPGAAAVAVAPVPKVPKIALVMKTLTNPFFIEMEKGARRAEAEMGVELQVRTAAQETSIEQQIQIINDLITARVDAIVIAPGDSTSLIPVLQKAAAAGIKLVNIDNRLNPQGLQQAGLAPLPFVSVDNEKAAFAAARFIAEGAPAGTQAAILEGIRSADNAQQRLAGARRAFTENKAITLVVSESANWKIDEGYSVTKKIFQTTPKVKLLFAANDMMALGALKYLHESRRSSVKVAGYDALDEAVAAVKSGQLAVTVNQQAAEQGFQGVALAVRLLHGESVPEVMLIDSRLVTRKSLN